MVATINGKQITAKEAESYLSAIPPDQLKRYESNLSAVVQQIYMSQQLAQQAEKMNLDQQSPWKEQLQLTRENILTQAYLNKLTSSSTATATGDPQQYYNAHPLEFDRVKLSGIFVAFNPPGTPASGSASSRTEPEAHAKADDIEKKLKAGGDFATLARTESDNQQAASRGGDLGTYSVGDPQLPASIKTAIQSLQAGQSSEPIRIPNALLIVKLDSRTKLTFDQAKPEIQQKLKNEQSQAAVKQEVDKYKIQVQDPAFFNQTGTSSVHTPSLARPGDATAPPPGATTPHR
ncbi:MAG TPA: peptidylprolyl isomerase [Bryobacteraceae bacterium]|nr:peptidylprolyl isomerase [Bryobacteraceae bacterium]